MVNQSTLNNKFGASINTKRKEALKICYAIKEYFNEELGLKLPRYSKGIFKTNIEIQNLNSVLNIAQNPKNDFYTSSSKESDFKIVHEEFWQYDAYGSELFEAYGDLAKMYYNLLLCNIKAEAVFNDPIVAGNYQSQLIACKYSKHRLDPIWNFRKSRLIRSKYSSYLKETQLHKKYHPVHLTLTVPHKDGLFNGKKFYASELMESFNKLRKTYAWKKYVFAGEYGVEVKPSPGTNGLHIHIHSLVFQHPQYSVNLVRDEIENEWKKIVGNESSYSGMHYETLYFFKKKEGEREFETTTKYKKVGDTYEKTVVKKKHYLDCNSSDEDLISGIMECIKYHFKHDIFAIDSTKYNGYDVAFLGQICKETKNKRLYSRFGAFYKESRLNFNNLESDGNSEEISHSLTFDDYYSESTENAWNPDDETEMRHAQEESEKGYRMSMSYDDEGAERSQRSQFTDCIMCKQEARLVNPYTGEKAYRFEYQLTITYQNAGRYMSRYHGFVRDNTIKEERHNLRMDLTFSQCWAMIMQGKINEVLENKKSLFVLDSSVEEQMNY